jgi:hypothetical protein
MDGYLLLGISEWNRYIWIDFYKIIEKLYIKKINK